MSPFQVPSNRYLPPVASLASLARTQVVVISLDDYAQVAMEEHCTASLEAPADPTFLRYRCSTRDFLNHNVYPVWYTNKAHDRELSIQEHGAEPILFRDFAANPLLRDRRLEELRRNDRPLRGAPHVLVEHCAGCDRRVVKDDCKGLLLLAVEGKEVQLSVTEVTGKDWSGPRFDMRMVCACPRQL